MSAWNVNVLYGEYCVWRKFVEAKTVWGAVASSKTVLLDSFNKWVGTTDITLEELSELEKMYIEAVDSLKTV